MASTLDSVPDSGPFDPYNQNIIITMPDGETQFAANIQTIFALQSTAVNQAILFGIQIGLSVLLMVILALMTKSDKRRNVIFIFNMTALVFIFIRAIIQVVQLAGPLYNYYNWAAAYYPDTAESERQSVAADVMTFIIVLSLELSLAFQVRIVCCTLSRWLRWGLDLLSGAAVLSTVSVRFAAMVVNIKYNILSLGSTDQHNLVTELSSAANITLMCSITFFSIMFVAKLAHAIYQRHKMGMKQFGPMQIVFVMGCQTLIVPVIFGILSYWVLPGSQLYSMVPVVVATFLPLSSIWASTNTANANNIAAPNQWQERRRPSTAPSKRHYPWSSEKGLLPTTVNTTVNTECTLVDDRQQSVSEPSPSKPYQSTPRDRDSIDLEMQKMGRIRVDRAYSVRSD